MFFTVEDPEKLVKQKSRTEIKTIKNILHDNLKKLTGKNNSLDLDNKERDKARDNEQ